MKRFEPRIQSGASSAEIYILYEMTALLLEIKPETQRLVDNLLSLDECLEPCHKSGRWGDGRGREGDQKRTRGGIEEMRRGGGGGTSR